MRFERDKLMINRNNATGLSVRDGSPITRLSDLPPYKVEVRHFHSSREAEIFIEGLETAGLGNALVYDWNTGETFCNSIVILGRVTEEVHPDTPFEDRISFIELQNGDHDLQARQRYMNRVTAERQSDYEHQAAEAREILSSMGRSENLKDVDFGRGWMRFGRGKEDAISVDWTSMDGPFSISLNAIELQGGWYDASAELHAHAESLGYRLDEAWMLESFEPVAREGLGDAAVELSRVNASLAAERKRLFHEAFKAQTKMKSSWRKLIRAGAEHGITNWIHRRLEKASAGGAEIGPNDINTLLIVGWLERDDARLKVTEAGMIAAGIEPQPASSAAP